MPYVYMWLVKMKWPLLSVLHLALILLTWTSLLCTWIVMEFDRTHHINSGSICSTSTEKSVKKARWLEQKKGEILKFRNFLGAPQWNLRHHEISSYLYPIAGELRKKMTNCSICSKLLNFKVLNILNYDTIIFTNLILLRIYFICCKIMFNLYIINFNYLY